MNQRPPSFAIKAQIDDIDATILSFPAQKTMYGGKTISVGDMIFLFTIDHEGGDGLVARGVVTRSAMVPRTTAARQTPRVSITVEQTGSTKPRFGRRDVEAFRDWADGAPETELNFKLYRQATPKIVGLTDKAGDFLNSVFEACEVEAYRDLPGGSETASGHRTYDR